LPFALKKNINFGVTDRGNEAFKDVERKEAREIRKELYDVCSLPSDEFGNYEL
jgi:hypothetical protein